MPNKNPGKHINTIPALNMRQVLELRRRVREGDLRTHSIRSIAYEYRSLVGDIVDALVGRGQYLNYPREGVFDAAKYAPFLDATRQMSLNAFNALYSDKSQVSRSQAQLASATEAVKGLEYKVDRDLLVHDVSLNREPLTISMANAASTDDAFASERDVEEPVEEKEVEMMVQPERKKQKPRGRKFTPDIQKQRDMRHDYMTRQDMSMRELQAKHGVSPETYYRVISGKATFSHWWPLPLRARGGNGSVSSDTPVEQRPSPITEMEYILNYGNEEQKIMWFKENGMDYHEYINNRDSSIEQPFAWTKFPIEETPNVAAPVVEVPVVEVPSAEITGDASVENTQVQTQNVSDTPKPQPPLPVVPPEPPQPPQPPQEPREPHPDPRLVQSALSLIDIVGLKALGLRPVWDDEADEVVQLQSLLGELRAMDLMFHEALSAFESVINRFKGG